MTAMVLVQKFGGTSVSTPEARQRVIGHVRRAREEGFRVAVVVSAMGRRGDPYATDTLLDLLRVDGEVDARDYDLIFSCGEAISAALMSHLLKHAGIPAIGMTSAQARIYTDDRHGGADIVRIDASRLMALMEAGQTPVVTGAQGVAQTTFDFTTLGRGGSDTSGVALGVALAASQVEIYTDVEGVSTADPRLVPEAALLRHVSYAAMFELARFGAKVVHPRAVAAGWQAGIPIVVRSTFSDDPGTMISGVSDEAPIVGIAALSSLETVGISLEVGRALKRRDLERSGVVILSDRQRRRLLLGAGGDQVAHLRRSLEGASAEDGAEEIGTCSWISLVGNPAGIIESHRVAVSQLRAMGIDKLGQEIAERRATYVVPRHERDRAIAGLHDCLIGATARAPDQVRR